MLKKLLTINLIIIVILLTACSGNWDTSPQPTLPTTPDTPEPTTSPSEMPVTATDLPDTPTASATVGSPTEPPTSTETPQSDATDEPTATPNLSEGNLFKNPSFEGAFYTWSYRPSKDGALVFIPSIQLAVDWDPFFCQILYTPDPCYAKGVEMGLPEYKPSAVRVFEGEQSQYLFCFSRPCDAGVSQLVATDPGLHYRVTVHYQIWSEDGWFPEDEFGNTWESHGVGLRLGGEDCVQGLPFSSDTCTKDDRGAARVFIAVDKSGSNFIYSSSTFPPVREYRGWSEIEEDNCYDKFCKVTLEFYANSAVTRIYLGGKFRYPFVHNDLAIDMASIEIISE